MKNSLLILMILCMFAACNQSTTRTSRYTPEQIAALQIDSTTILSAETDSIITIDVNPFLKRQLFIDFDTLVNDIKLIPLETTDESLLDDINKIIITDSHIYIFDELKGGGLAVFDRNGKFIKRMSYGQGPGDIARLYDISFDEE
ncbi:MAG: 6-bladed beta-propeller, partial [Prevotellaceae bacterium]|nr:6-bladed beta-propeller [Prevotellaceae bacterium]